MNYKSLKEISKDKLMRKEAAKQSLFIFALLYFPDVFQSKPSEFHKEMARDLDNMGDDFSHMLIVGFRESAKTVYAKIKFLHQIVYKKKRFIIWCSYDKVKARGKLFDIAVQLQTNPRIIRDFGQLYFGNDDEVKKSKKKGIGEFITVNDVKCQSFSIGESPRGLVYGSIDGEFRPDFWVLDDVDVLKSVENKDVIDKNYEWFTDEMLSGLSYNANVLFLGNRIKGDGIIPRLEEFLEVPKDIINKGMGRHKNKRWKYLNQPIEYNGEPTWPERHSMYKEEGKVHLHGEGGLEELLGHSTYNSQMLNIIAKNDKIFDTSKLTVYIHDDERPSKLNIFMVSDLAISEKKQGDETVHLVCGVDEHNNLWIIDFFNGKVKPKESIDIIMDMHRKYRPIKYGMETISFQRSMKYSVEDEQKERGYYFKIHELKAENSKYERIMGLQPHLERGKIFIPRRFIPMKIGKENIIEQFDKFPYSKHDDIIDAFAYVLQLAFPIYNTEK